MRDKIDRANHPFWALVRELTDRQANIIQMIERAEVIQDHADNHDLLNTEPSFDQIFIEATALARELEVFRQLIAHAIRAIENQIPGAPPESDEYHLKDIVNRLGEIWGKNETGEGGR